MGASIVGAAGRWLAGHGHGRGSEDAVVQQEARLEDRRHLVIAKIGTANAYILDPADVWKNYERYKGYCGFHANALASKSQNKLLKARLTHMLEGQGDLFSEEEPPSPAKPASEGKPRSGYRHFPDGLSFVSIGVHSRFRKNCLISGSSDFRLHRSLWIF